VDSSPEEIARFNELMAQVQILGEPIAEQDKTGLAQIGLMAYRAAVLFESYQLEDFGQEIEHILAGREACVGSFPKTESVFQRVEKIAQMQERMIHFHFTPEAVQAIERALGDKPGK
jgi:hypothetical protein